MRAVLFLIIVWFAHIIEWEFPNFSVDKCFEQLLKMQEMIDKDGRIEGTIHRYLIVAKKQIERVWQGKCRIGYILCRVRR